MPLFVHRTEAIHDGDTVDYLHQKVDDIARVISFMDDLTTFLEGAAETPEFDDYLSYYEGQVRRHGYESPLVTHIFRRAVESERPDTALQILEDFRRLRSALQTVREEILQGVEAYAETGDKVVLDDLERSYNRVLHNIDMPSEKDVLDNRDEEQDRYQEMLDDKEQRQTTEGSDDIDDVLRVLTRIVGDLPEHVEKEFRDEFHKVEETQGKGGLPVGGSTLAVFAVQAAMQTTGLDLSDDALNKLETEVAEL